MIKALISERQALSMTKEIVLAGGCFWGCQAYFEQLKGVVATTVGYAQSRVASPSYEEVKSQTTGAAEAVKIVYDPKQITLTDLIGHLFRFIDPTVKDHQAHDYGNQYRTGIYYSDVADQMEIAAALKEQQKNFSKPILTENMPLGNFYRAEDYHQDYLAKNPGGYCHVNLALIRPDEKK